MRTLDREARPATAEEQQVLARWGSWGAIPQLFDERKDDWADLRHQLKGMLTESEYRAASRTTINAHYTDPAYVAPMWKALEDLGFTSGKVLEPGCGSGTFMGLAPQGAQMVGVELDPISASVAKYLYPSADVRAESFAATVLPDGYFDAAIGNVPFGNVALHDPRHNHNRHSIHNHFIIKSLSMVRPGGVAAFLTSSFTMDSKNAAARREMAQLGDLVGAVRLPTGAHRRAAGTEAVTDLLLFRRREDDERLTIEPDWVRTRMEIISGQSTMINNYFGQNPSHVLGELSLDHGMHGAQTLRVTPHPDQNTDQLLAQRLESITASARVSGNVGRARTQAEADAVVGQVADPSAGLWDGHISASADGFTVLEQGMHVPLRVFKKDHAELRALLGLRDQARTLLELEASNLEDLPETVEARSKLSSMYTAYKDTYGPINRVKTSPTGRVNEDGEPIFRRVVPHAVSKLRQDPLGALVTSIENYDEETGTATPAAILHRRVVSDRAVSTSAKTPAEAIAVSLDTVGKVDLEIIASSLGIEVEDARGELGDLVFDDPATGEVVPRAAYLSGNIAIKLDAAREAAVEAPEKYGRNIQALEQVMPVPLGPDEIAARVGAPWIPDTIYTEFLEEITGSSSLEVKYSRGGVWEVEGYSPKWETPYSTGRRSVKDLFSAMLAQRKIEVLDEGPDGKKVMNSEETEAAQDKARAIQERFEEWAWETPERSAELQRIYNRKFNSIALRDYTEEGKHLALPGLAATFKPRDHQLTAVARMINEPSVGLFHEVGAGKTAEMVMGAMELKRLGLIRKPCVVVPNHMLEQFGREWLQLYPHARVLTASSEDLRGDGKRRLVARAAANDWDGVILTYNAFEAIPVRDETRLAYIESETQMYRQALELAQEGEGGPSVKALEKRLLSATQVLEKRLEPKGKRGICWEETGIDYLIVDELHSYKNLTTMTAMEGAPVNTVGSRRASDLHMKVDYLRQRHGERVMTGATATPLANSMAEAFIMTRYLRPDLLEDAGLDVFDGWAATFAEKVTELEIKPADTTQFKAVTRFAKFQNVPELLRMWHTFADVKTADDLNLDTPDLKVREDGQRLPIIRNVPPSPELEEFVARLAMRAENLSGRAEKGGDNMLKITGDGRHAALDMRLVGKYSSTDTKIDLLADEAARIYQENKDRQYLIDVNDPEQGLHPRPGALQIIWSDLGTPKPDEWNVYDELKAQLVKRGVPAEQVRFIHEAKTDNDKGRLFEACRSGQVAVIIGSTEKMGVGANIQNRAVAMHHMECPWRPADVQQREGRIIRQGNQNKEVEIYRWVTEKSFDSYMWQTVERKAKFINQVMTGKLNSREIEDVSSSQQLSFSEVKAVATGNPLVMEKTAADAEVTKYARLFRAWEKAQVNAERNVQIYTTAVAEGENLLTRLEQLQTQSVDTSADKFAMTIGDHTLTKRTDAADAISRWATQIDLDCNLRYRFINEPAPVLRVGGHQIMAKLHPRGYNAQAGRVRDRCVEFSLEGAPEVHTVIDYETLRNKDLGSIARIENLTTSGIASRKTTVSANMVRARETLAQSQATLGRPFRHKEAYEAAKIEQARINELMNPTKPSDPEEETPTEPRYTSPENPPRSFTIDISDPPHYPGGTPGMSI